MIWVVIVRMICALSFSCVIILCKSALYITYRARGVIGMSRVLKGTIENLNTESQVVSEARWNQHKNQSFSIFFQLPSYLCCFRSEEKTILSQSRAEGEEKTMAVLISAHWKSCVHKIIIQTLHTLYNTLLLWLQY